MKTMFMVLSVSAVDPRIELREPYRKVLLSQQLTCGNTSGFYSDFIFL